MKPIKETVKNNRTVRYSYYTARGLAQKRKLKKKAEATLDKFGVRFPSAEAKKKQLSDMLAMNRKYGFGFDEYLLLGFAKRSMAERLTFVADWEHLGYTNAMNDLGNAGIFDDKWKTYQTFRPYYRRDVAFIDEQARETFAAFADAHDVFVVKPLDESCGHGVRIIGEEGETEDLDGLFAELLQTTKGRFLVEEKIAQAEEMARFHPASVNTVRVPTVRTEKGLHIVHPFFRIGQQGKRVDNGGAGGIISAVDAETGVVLAAADEHGGRFEVHPDTKLPIVGFTIPRWEEAKALVAELAKIVPDNHYTGWDLALTDDGWVLVEANRRGQFLWQIPLQKGSRKEINGYLRELGVKY